MNPLTAGEWSKAAYHDPFTGGCFDYPTGSDSAPRAVAGGTVAGTAVYGGQPLADATAAGGLSPHGTMGQGGNVWEWDETALEGGRGLRGGSYHNTVTFLEASQRHAHGVLSEFGDIGLRVAAIPEPGGWPLALMIPTGLWLWRRRSVRHAAVRCPPG